MRREANQDLNAIYCNLQNQVEMANQSQFFGAPFVASGSMGKSKINKRFTFGNMVRNLPILSKFSKITRT